MKKRLAQLALAIVLVSGATVGYKAVEAAVTYPSSWYYDIWEYGTWSGRNHSNYQVTDKRRIGAKATVTDGVWWGARSTSYANYGWARANVKDVKYIAGQASWDYYWF